MRISAVATLATAGTLSRFSYRRYGLRPWVFRDSLISTTTLWILLGYRCGDHKSQDVFA